MVLTDNHSEAGAVSADRQSSFELMRIVAMVLVVAGHFGAHSGFDFPAKEFCFNRWWIELFEIGGNISVNVLVLLSGYFRIQSQGPKTAKLIQLWLQLFFYSIGIYLIFVVAGKDPLAIGEILRRALPVSFMQWWFASTYLVLSLFSPYLNRLLRSFSRKQYLGFLTMSFFCCSLMPTLTGQDFESNHLTWFIFLYALAAYIRLYGISIHLSAGKLIALSAVCALLTFSSVLLLETLSLRFAYLQNKIFYFYEIQRIPLLVISLLIFLGFSRLRMKNHRWLNQFAAAMFGVYLIHDHEYVRYFLWLDVFHNMHHAQDPLLFVRFIGEVMGIFFSCALIELIRIHLVEKHYMPIVYRAAGRIDQITASLFHQGDSEK